MGLFSNKKVGGMMDMIRCDEQDYLIWKWRPKGNEVNSTNKENAIRWGSSLRVKDGEVAVFETKSIIAGGFETEQGVVPVMNRQYSFGRVGGHLFVFY
jgi:hypothetical protein